MTAPVKGLRLFGRDFEIVRSLATQAVELLTAKVAASKTEGERTFYEGRLAGCQSLADRCNAALLADTSGDAEPDEDEDEEEEEPYPEPDR